MTDFCSARCCDWASEYGYGSYDLGTIGYQCGTITKKGPLCGIHSRNGTPFGLFGKKAPEYAASNGKMVDGTTVESGEALCWIYKKPDVDDDGNIIHDKQQELDDNYWQCDDNDDCDDDDCYDDDCYDDDCDDVSPSNTYKGLKVSQLKDELDTRNLPTHGLKKVLLQRLLDDDNGVQHKSSSQKNNKTKRKPSKYNLFMQKQLPLYKSKHPNASHSKAFSQCASLWSKSKLE